MLRLVDGLAKAWLLAVLIPRAAGWLDAMPARMLAVMGRQSLPVFVLGLVLSTVCGVILRETGFVLAIQIGVLIGGSAILICFAVLLDWQARMGKRDAAVALPEAEAEVRPAPGPAAPLAKVLAEPSTK
ncbi:MAG: OpgC domain-containing protein [Hyphomicrobiales bacterium]|nr:OpgC domain-containing protein [Hyphomicrobiales bacterium]